MIDFNIVDFSPQFIQDIHDMEHKQWGGMTIKEKMKKHNIVGKIATIGETFAGVCYGYIVGGGDILSEHHMYTT